MSTHGPAVLGYLTRRTDPPHDGADLMAEVFIVAWRRLDSVPREPDQARAWLLGVARHQLANHRRGRIRRIRLADRLRQHLLVNAPDPDDGPRPDVRAALATLSEDDRELLTLVTWEGLTPSQVATVLRLSPGAARKRLERARRRLRAELERPAGTGHANKDRPAVMAVAESPLRGEPPRGTPPHATHTRGEIVSPVRDRTLGPTISGHG